MLQESHFTIDEKGIALAALDAAFDKRVSVALTDGVWRGIEKSASAIAKLSQGKDPVYGVNTGFGHLCRKRVPADQLAQLQTNLILSHAVGVGDPAPPQIVRWMMLLKIVGLSRGYSGITRPTLECLVRMLNADILPVIPTQGSLGASGDLAPLAHMVLGMLGEGNVVYEGNPMPAREALQRAGIEPARLAPKEGLALINGTQFMAAYAAAVVVRGRRLAKHADIIASMSVETLMGSHKPFDKRLHDLRPHPGAVQTADNMRRLLADSEIVTSHAHCDRVQDPYSLRCIPQVHGASRDALDHATEVVEREINAVTDNPILLGESEVISGGLFHGQPLALALDYLAIALAEFASISERRIYLLLSGVEGLPVLLMQDTGLNSGFMLPQYTAAALVSENKGLCTPSSVDSIPTSLGQEDHVSMGARAAVKCRQVLFNSETVLAIEQMCAAQGLDFRAPLKPGIGPRAADAEIRRHITFADTDRNFGDDIQTSLSLLRGQKVLESVESETGALH